MKKQASFLTPFFGLVAAGMLLLAPASLLAQTDTPAELPFDCSFEQADDASTWHCATLSPNSANQWVVGNAVGHYGYALYVSSDNGQSNTYLPSPVCNCYAYRTVNITSAGEYAFGFDWRCQGETGTFDYLRAILIPATTTVSANLFGTDNTALTAAGGFDLSGRTEVPYTLSGTTAWLTATGTVTITSPGLYRLLFAWHNDMVMGNQPPAAVDNIHLAHNVCAAPFNLRDSNVTTSGFVLLWDGVGDEDRWMVTIDGASHEVTSPTFSATGLQPNRPYVVTVRSICANDDTSLARVDTFYTACATISQLPYTQTFEAYPFYAQPHCWTCSPNNTYVYVREGVHVLFAHSDAQHDSIFMSLPPVDTALFPIRTLQLAFDAAKFLNIASPNYRGDLLVGVCSRPGDVASFVAVDTICNMPYGPMVSYLVDFADYADTGRYITFLSHALADSVGGVYNDVAVDNVVLAARSDCRRPESLSVVRVAEDTVAFAWTDTLGNAWTVCYGPYGFDPDTSTVRIAVAQQHAITLTGLRRGTRYDGYVRTCCGDSAVSIWRGPVGFRTPDTVIVPDCGRVMALAAQASPHAALVTWTPSSYGDYLGATVQYRALADTAWQTLTTADDYAVITGLDTVTNYLLRVQALCLQGSAQWDTVPFTTCGYGCALVEPDRVGDTIRGAQAVATYQLPLCNWYNYSFSEQLYTAAELQGQGMLSGIDLHYIGQVPMTAKGACMIYLDTTSEVGINLTHYRMPAQMTMVYSGPMNCTPGWHHFQFATPFEYTGGNLLVAVVDHSGDYDGSAYTFSAHAAAEKAIGYSDDNFPFSGSQLQTFNYRNDAVFHWDGGCLVPEVCPAPVVAAEAVDSAQVRLLWAPGGAEQAWNVYYAPADSGAFVFAGMTTALQYLITGLLPSTQYRVRVAPICDSADEYVEGSYAEAVVWTGCGLAPLPLTEDFDEAIFGETFQRPCWRAGATRPTATHPRPSINTLVGETNQRCLIADGGYLVLPRVNAPLNTLQLRLSLAQADNVRLLLGLLDSLDAPIDSIRPVDTLCRSQVAQFGTSVSLTIPLDGLPPTASGHLVFYDAFNDGISLIDDLVVEAIPLCPAVGNLSVSAVTAYSADVAWSAGGILTSGYRVEYGSHHFSLGSGRSDTTANNYISLSGLAPGTYYDVYVFALCNDDTSLASTPAQFLTLCDTLVLPYGEAFESCSEPGYTYSALPPCWAYALDNAARYGYAYYEPSVYCAAGLGYAASGNYCLRLYSTSTVALPPSTVPLQQTVLTFVDHCPNPAVYKIVVGVVDSLTPGFEASFVPVDTLDTYEVRTSYYVPLRNYHGSGRHVAFRTVNLYGYDFSCHYLDDIRLYDIYACTQPMNLSATTLTATSASVTWDTCPALRYQFEYGLHGFARGTGRLDTCQGAMASINGLMPNTRYDVYVRGLCDSGGVSPWSEGYAFSTLSIDPVTELPYVCDFADTTLPNSGWLFVNGEQENQWVVGDAVAHNSPNALYVSDNGGDSNSYHINSGSVAYAYRSFVLDAGAYKFCYDWKGMGETSWDYLRVWLVPASYQLQPGLLPDGTSRTLGYQTGVPADWLPLDGGRLLNNAPSWQHRVEGVVVTTPGTYNMVAMWANDDYGGHQPPAAIDNVEVMVNTCPSPVDVHAASAGVTSIVVDWTDVVHPLGWQLAYGPHGFALGQGHYRCVASHPVSLYGLDTLSAYDVYVRPICAVGDTGLWTPVAVISTSSDTGASDCPSPQVDSVVVSSYDEALVSWSGSGSVYQVDVRLADGATYANAVAVNDTFYLFSGLFPASRYLFRVRQDCSADSMGFSDWVEGCFVTDSMPCLAPTSLEAVEVDYNQVTLAWLLGSSESVWQLHVFNTTFDTLVLCTATMATMAGLLPGMTYDAAVRALCGETYGSGVWSDTIRFTMSICDTVAQVRAVAQGINVTVSWLAGANNSGAWEVDYGPMGYGVGEGYGSVVTDTTSYTFAGLEPYTAYGFHVRALCAADWLSTWSSLAATAVTTDSTQGIVAPVDRVVVFTQERTIVVCGADGRPLALYDMMGRRLDVRLGSSTEERFALPSAGVFLLRIGAEGVRRVVVR